MTAKFNALAVPIYTQDKVPDDAVPVALDELPRALFHPDSVIVIRDSAQLERLRATVGEEWKDPTP